jgi:hypothetical protein
MSKEVKDFNLMTLKQEMIDSLINTNLFNIKNSENFIDLYSDDKKLIIDLFDDKEVLIKENLSRLKNEANINYQYYGRTNLYVGYPFIYGKINRKKVCAPLVFVPVSIKDNYIKLEKNKDLLLNPLFWKNLFYDDKLSFMDNIKSQLLVKISRYEKLSKIKSNVKIKDNDFIYVSSYVLDTFFVPDDLLRIMSENKLSQNIINDFKNNFEVVSNSSEQDEIVNSLVQNNVNLIASPKTAYLNSIINVTTNFVLNDKRVLIVLPYDKVKLLKDDFHNIAPNILYLDSLNYGNLLESGDENSNLELSNAKDKIDEINNVLYNYKINGTSIINYYDVCIGKKIDINEYSNYAINFIKVDFEKLNSIKKYFNKKSNYNLLFDFYNKYKGKLLIKPEIDENIVFSFKQDILKVKDLLNSQKNILFRKLKILKILSIYKKFVTDKIRIEDLDDYYNILLDYSFYSKNYKLFLNLDDDYKNYFISLFDIKGKTNDNLHYVNDNLFNVICKIIIENFENENSSVIHSLNSYDEFVSDFIKDEIIKEQVNQNNFRQKLNGQFNIQDKFQIEKMLSNKSKEILSSLSNITKVVVTSFNNIELLNPNFDLVILYNDNKNYLSTLFLAKKFLLISNNNDILKNYNVDYKELSLDYLYKVNTNIINYCNYKKDNFVSKTNKLDKINLIKVKGKNKKGCNSIEVDRVVLILKDLIMNQKGSVTILTFSISQKKSIIDGIKKEIESDENFKNYIENYEKNNKNIDFIVKNCENYNFNTDYLIISTIESAKEKKKDIASIKEFEFDLRNINNSIYFVYSTENFMKLTRMKKLLNELQKNKKLNFANSNKKINRPKLVDVVYKDLLTLNINAKEVKNGNGIDILIFNQFDNLVLVINASDNVDYDIIKYLYENNIKYYKVFASNYYHNKNYELQKISLLSLTE